MNDKDKQEIVKILKEIKKKSVLAVKGGSGGAKRYAMRDPHIVWTLGSTLDNILKNNDIPDEKRKEEIRKIARTIDYRILGKGNEWCVTAYDWYNRFQDKEHFLFVCSLAGYRKNEDKNRFNKRRVNYLKSIYAKNEEPNLPKNKISKLTKILEKDDVLELNDPDYLNIITKIRGKQKIDWNSIQSSLEELENIVEEAMDERDNEQARKELRENLGETLITQLRYALQLCVMDNKSDFDFASEKVKDIFKKKPKTKEPKFQELFMNLKPLLKNFEEKKKRIKKKDYYEIEQLNSNLDAIKDENIYQEYMKRKDSIGNVFG